MSYGMLAAENCLLTDISDQLHEETKKKNTVERFTRHLDNGIPKEALWSYLAMVYSWAPAEPVIHVDDSDVVKPERYKFKALHMVRDGSQSSSSKTIYTKGYHVTEACVMTSEGNPVSIFSKIHSSAETCIPLSTMLLFLLWNEDCFV